MITKDLGLVTAYAYAVSGGYTGTEAEFTELLGNIAEDLEEIENLSVTVETLPPGSEATASYSDGVLHLGIPRGDKGDKGDTGETGPQGPKGDPGDVSTEQLDEAISGVRAEMEESYARNDGYYEEMTVGDAEQLISTQFVEDSEPYLFRPTGGSADVGDREYLDKIVGGTVAWNQLVNNTTSAETSKTINGVTYTLKADKSIVLNGTATANTWFASVYWNIAVDLANRKGHKLLLDSGANGKFYAPERQIGGSSAAYPMRTSNAIIVESATSSDNQTLQFFVIEGETFNNMILRPQLIDLTAMFGSTIADYIYSLEQAQAGAGVAWFRQYFPNDYYPYDPGTLRSVEGVSAHETVGFNQWDEEWENGWWNYQTGVFTASSSYFACKSKIAVFPNTEYYWKCPTNVRELQYYDANGEPLGRRNSYAEGYANTTFTTPDGCYYLTFYFGSSYGATYKHDICINLSDPTRNGEYEPYTKHTYPLDSSLTLRSVPKLVDGKLAFDGDVYPPSGEVQRRYGVVDLGTLSFNKNGSDPIYYATIPNKANGNTNIFSDKFIVCPVAIANMADGSMRGYSSSAVVYFRRNDCETLADWNAWLTNNPTHLIYELATPTTETAEGYEHYQICDPSGTEEFVTTGIVPVGHETRYPANLRDKLQHLPDLPSPLLDGAYMVMVNGSQMHLERFLIPDAPTTDGTYTLKATVSGGTPVYTWEVEA